MGFTDDFFSRNIPVWTDLFNRFKPTKALEIGSYEGRSAKWLLDNIHGLDLTCVDTWDNTGIEEGLNSLSAEATFDAVVGSRVKKIKGRSGDVLRKLEGLYDFIYIDGDHYASSVLEDMVLSFGLLRSGGIMVCDDYLGGWGRNPLEFPKVAVDAFVNCYSRQIDLIIYPLNQIYIVKK